MVFATLTPVSLISKAKRPADGESGGASNQAIKEVLNG